ncbi:hypothetical protein F511_20321 [Dorcoceras hygrometricum]|uniref:Mitotic spindle checkpoint protein MAD1 n=1 Tax=Dorcoceras hygrometricum TaxID=472368 RepID=A0A2Z7CMZ4_9LAMI|nr:hypothetical protein F511_20321 [Dorcoceras hygrometricum]
MILRTPPPRKRRAESLREEDRANPSPNSNRQLVIFEDLPEPEHSHGHSLPVTSDHMLCTYQCRQMVKSEFFDALSSAEKQARDYQSKFERLNDDFRKVVMNPLIRAFKRLFEFGTLDICHSLFQCMQLTPVPAAAGDPPSKVKFRNEMDLRKKAELSASKADDKASILDGKLTTLAGSADKEKCLLQSEIVQLRSESKFSISKIRAECMHDKLALEKKLSSVTSLEAPSKDADLLVKHLQEELRNYESEVREARKIKASHDNIELLKEKLHEEKSRRERTEIDLLKLADIQSRMKMLDDELTTWKSVIKEIPGVSSADDIPLKFAALQKEIVDGMIREGEAQAKMKQIQVALDTSMLDKQEADTDAMMAKERAESYKEEIQRLELMLASITEERDHLRIVVNGLKDHTNLQGAAESVSGTIVQELEMSLSKKEIYIIELKKNLVELREINSRQHDEIKLLSDRLTNEARRLKMLEREDDRLRSEISLLEAKLGHGDFSSANTKVLRMVNTLAVDNEAKQTIEALQNELQKTKEKLLAVEELKKQSPDAGTLVDSYVAGKIKQLKEQIATLEKREERYKTVFADKISVFRRACCELFGYKIVMDDHQRSDGIPVTRFILHSIYAMSDEEKLVFEYESGNTNLTVNAYTMQPEISRQVDIFIRKMNSIPAFISNLTVESFNKRTLS